VEAHWDLGPIALDPLPGGMNSTTWTVTTPGGHFDRRWVAKLVRADQRDGFLRGLRAAIRVEGAGIPTGPPEPTRDGHSSVDVADGVMALLRWVDGYPLSGASAHEQTLIGTTLGRAHRALRGAREVEPADAADFPQWVDPDAPHLTIEDWIRPAVGTALAQYTKVRRCRAHLRGAPRGPGTRGVLVGLGQAALRTDRLVQRDARARAVRPGHGRHVRRRSDRAGTLLEAYTRTAALPAAEITRGLDVLLLVRWAVQADYFARRLAAEDCTGISEPAQNLAGLVRRTRLLQLRWVSRQPSRETREPMHSPPRRLSQASVLTPVGERPPVLGHAAVMCAVVPTRATQFSELQTLLELRLAGGDRPEHTP
jgi:hypothetical protein